MPVRTLDDLIAEFGHPSYVKLDVEGTEAEALGTLSEQVRVVSFESHGQNLDVARACVEALAGLGRYQFMLTPGEFLSPLWPEWRNERQLIGTLERDPLRLAHVFARLTL